MRKRNTPLSDNELKAVVLKLVVYCRKSGWAGYDPYDALNSKLVTTFPFLNSKLPRIALTQVLKRSPVNLRRLLLIPKTQNPKALALFLAALVKLQKSGIVMEDGEAAQLVDRLIALRARDVSYWCWGYSFPWQTRTLLVPAGAANLVCTAFVADALLDAYEHYGDARCLSMAASAAEYMINDLYWSDGTSMASFSYPSPAARSRVHNANLLAAALLCRVCLHTGKKKFLAPALKAAAYSASRQNDDGSWFYGEEPSQQWIDNFHTGYNLCALRAISRYAGTIEFNSCINKGFKFYRDHFFRDDGAPRYFHDQTYPIDIHCVAQGVLTLLAFRDIDPESVFAARLLLEWAIDHMWNDRGFFYYRVLRSCTIRTSYMRWSQAWMMMALSACSDETAPTAERGPSRESLAAAASR